MLVWQRLGAAIDRHGKAALVSVVSVAGSAPREAGARMIVMPDGSFTGTIGGGTLEWRAIAEAQRALAGEGGASLALTSVALGPDLGQCCGGRVALAIERWGADRRAALRLLAEAEAAGPFHTEADIVAGQPIERRILAMGDVPIGGARLVKGRLEEGFGEDPRALFLFGAGHVGRALVLALAPLPFSVHWIDPRPDAFPARVPANCHCIQQTDAPGALRAAPDGAFVVVMTHSHGLDLAIVHKALADDRFGYVGLIGSASKRARFTRLLGEAGLEGEKIQSMHCPIGIAGIHSKLPAVIAASVASDLLVRDEAARSAGVSAAEKRPDVLIRVPRESGT